jgi:6-phosphogluconolactonase (cycloisomerase 2 family)
VRRRLVLPAAIAALGLALPGASADAANLYLPNYGTTPEGISGYARAPDGSLSPLAGSPFPVPAAATGILGLAFTPDGGRAVATFLFNGGVLGLTVAGDGSIAAPEGPIDTPSVTSIAVSPDGRFAYAPTRDFMSEAAIGIPGYSIGANGSLTPISGSPFSSGEFADVAITPDGRFLFGISGGQVKHFAIGADGKLTDAGTSAIASAQNLAVSSDGRFLFVGISSAADGVASFSIGADGSLTQNGLPALTGNVGMRLFTVGPDARYVYMPDVNVNGIVTAAVAPDGALTVIGTMPVDDPEAVAVSPDGRFLYYARAGGPGLVGVASIGTDGLPTLLPFTNAWQSGERERILFGPTPAPVASFTQTRAVPAAASSFDATGSTRAARFDWDFGDGTTLADGGPTPAHTYAAAGIYQVTLTASDAQGCSTRFIYTGQSTVCPGGSSATTTAALDTLPALSALSVTNRRFAAVPAQVRRVKRGTAFRYTLSEAARVVFTIDRRTIGRRVGGTCRPLTRRNSRRKRCVLFRRAGRLAAAAKQGANRTRFNGRLRGRRLRPGPYRATAVATDSAGGKSARSSVRFRIVRPRRVR